MVFENIEKLKREFTDKYVVVDATQPELRRFEGQTGMIKTVNMNGNALVEFDGLNNIGWFDIGLDFLKVVDKPTPKVEPKKAAPAKKPAVQAAAKPPAKKAVAPAGGTKMSVAEMLAAARSEARGGGAPAAKKVLPADKPAAKPADAGAKMSVAEMLAAARAEKTGNPASASPTPPPVAKSPAEPEPEPVAAEAAAAEETPTTVGDLPKDTAGICAYCRKVDG